jgi:hypothetical protein
MLVFKTTFTTPRKITRWDWFRWLKFLTFFHSPSQHIKYAKRHMLGVLNLGKKITNYTVWMSFATRNF